MINAAFHVLAWGLVAALVWSSWFQQPAPVEPPFRAVAKLDEGFYLIGAQSDLEPQFGLLKHDPRGLGFRRLVLEDWERQLVGDLRALCAVPGYPGEVIALIGLSNHKARLVHLQVRRWEGNPKSAILSQLDVEQPGDWSSLACGNADQTQMPVTLSASGPQGVIELTGTVKFEPLSFMDATQTTTDAELPSAQFLDAVGIWRSYITPTGSRITFSPEGWDERPVYQVDGFSIVGLAAGSDGQTISFVAADPGMGNLWRPLALKSGD